jgi:hypothetical protein
MKVSFNFILKGLDGKEIQGLIYQVHAGMLLGNTMAGQSTQSDILKWMGWAHKLYDKQDIDISDNEKAEIKSFIEKTEVLTILAKQQLLDVLMIKKEKS